MDPRTFDLLARSLAAPRQLASRRRLFAAIPALAAAVAAPRLARAFDASGLGPASTPGEILCSGAADCPQGLICLNGVCAPLPVGGALDAPPLVEQPAVTPTPRPGAASSGSAATQPTPVAGDSVTSDETPEPGSTPEPSPTPANGIGGPGVSDDPLPAGIFRGRCGSLGADAAFPLIDVGSEQRPSSQAPDEAPDDPTDFSATVVNTSLDTLLRSEHAIDIRTDPKDPATSVACGDISGQVDETGAKRELPFALEEQNDSGVTGLVWIRDEGERALTYVYAERPEGESSEEDENLARFRDGEAVTAGTELNLRAEPSIDAPVVQVLGAGAELEVTGDSEDGWVPVREPESGSRGFVSEDFVEPAE
jgi:hypothetical protein